MFIANEVMDMSPLVLNSSRYLYFCENYHCYNNWHKNVTYYIMKIINTRSFLLIVFDQTWQQRSNIQPLFLILFFNHHNFLFGIFNSLNTLYKSNTPPAYTSSVYRQFFLVHFSYNTRGNVVDWDMYPFVRGFLITIAKLCFFNHAPTPRLGTKEPPSYNNAEIFVAPMLSK